MKSDTLLFLSPVGQLQNKMLIKLIILLLWGAFVYVRCTTLEECKQRCEVPIRTESGVVCGRVRRAEDGSKYASYRGIPYGKPPTGERRFKELEPVEPWSDQDPYYATEDSAACPQSDFYFEHMKLQPRGQSEDCIYLNLHVPCSHFSKNPSDNREKSKPLLPVLVFVHGGAFQSGSGLTDIQGPEYFMTKPVLIITFNYRLNVFGFLCLNTREIPGNQAFRDMITLLKWVQRNVKAFGGDPDNVTLMGQSGGATLAHLLALSNATKGLFQRVIIFSGTAFPSYYTTSSQYHKDVANLFLQQVGINSTDPKVIHEQLVKMPLIRIMEANAAVQYSNQTGFTTFAPVVDSEYPGITRVLDDDPLTLIAKGRGNEYPTIIGFTNNDIDFSKWYATRKHVLVTLENNPSAIVEPRLAYSLSKEEISDIATMIYKKYFDGRQPTMNQLTKFYTKQITFYAMLKLAQWLGAMDRAPTYLYQYSYEADFSVIRTGLWLNYTGATHFDDLAMMFRVNSILGQYNCQSNRTKNDDNMIVWMVQLVTNFMIYGSPLHGDTEGQWTPVSKDSVKYLDIRQPFQVTMSRPTAEQRDAVRFFDSFDPEVRNITSYLHAKGSL